MKRDLIVAFSSKRMGGRGKGVEGDQIFALL